MLETAGRVALVTGASRGIGRAVVARPLAEGYRVAAGVRDARGLSDTAALAVLRYDAEQPESADALVAATVARFGRLDAVVAAAGINPPAALLDADDTNFDRMWQVNMKAPRHLVRAAWPHLMASGTGRVALLASLSGKRVRAVNIGYAASKFAVVALVHGIRREGWDHGIRATAICPGFVDTDMTAHVTTVPRTQMTRPEDLAETIALALRLPNTAAMAEMLVNWRLEDTL